MKTEIIVSSKYFRKFLKSLEHASKRYNFEGDEILFLSGKDSIIAFGIHIQVEKNIAVRSEHRVKISSIQKAIKVLKQAPEQPIKVGFEDNWSALNIQCVF